MSFRKGRMASRRLFKLPSGRLIQFILIASIISVVGWLCLRLTDGTGRVAQKWLPIVPDLPLPYRSHPIDKLIEQSRYELQSLLAKETRNVQRGAEEYRKRRGRHPPPGFGAWYAFARKHNALIVEDFFDQIYTDLNPFWGLNATVLRQQAKTSKHRVIVRDGEASFVSDFDRPWMKLWHDLVSTMSEFLPDIDMPINVMDESRIVVPFEKLSELVDAERDSRRIVAEDEVVSKFESLADLDANPGEPFDPKWQHGNFWNLARVGCSPDSPSRSVPTVENFSGPPPLPTGYPEHSYKGYVSNWTAAKDVCAQPHLRELHGSFVEPISISTTHHLIPLFGGSKLPMNNEILIPPAMYWTHDEFYSGGEAHGPPWDRKKEKLMWRGSASGGRNRAENWTRFQRHRFISMVNGTAVKLAEQSREAPPNFDLPSAAIYKELSARRGYLGDWVSSFGDAAFTHLVCFPEEGSGKTCNYTGSYYSVKPSMHMQDEYKYKYLPDIDGNSFSGRYRGFLRSTSLPIKATIYNEWHDSRLIPWQHFVPMDNTFADIYGIMDYFLGDNTLSSSAKYYHRFAGARRGHDAQARKIAEDGSAWAEKVLRREDMQIYVFRLLLEFARICDERREYLGWVDDILGSTGHGGVGGNKLKVDVER